MVDTSYNLRLASMLTVNYELPAVHLMLTLALRKSQHVINLLTVSELCPIYISALTALLCINNKLDCTIYLY
jgi:hypothetical protein